MALVLVQKQRNNCHHVSRPHSTRPDDNGNDATWGWVWNNCITLNELRTNVQLTSSNVREVNEFISMPLLMMLYYRRRRRRRCIARSILPSTESMLSKNYLKAYHGPTNNFVCNLRWCIEMIGVRLFFYMRPMVIVLINHLARAPKSNQICIIGFVERTSSALHVKQIVVRSSSSVPLNQPTTFVGR